MSRKLTTEDRLDALEYLAKYLLHLEQHREKEYAMHRGDNNHNTMVILLVLLLLAMMLGVGALLMFMVIL